MGENTCERCGAERRRKLCVYCGSLAPGTEGQGDELAAIAELHRVVGEDGAAAGAKLLAHAFLPDDPRALIEAGLRVVPLVHDDKQYDPLVQAAVQRLQAVVMKLKILPDGPETRRAVDELEGRLRRHTESIASFDRSMMRWAIGFATAVILGVSSFIAWLVW